jgi:ADP-heptose:LPS heptosyltransferase
MVTGVVAYLLHRWPRARIDIYCSPHVMSLWAGLPVRVLPAPLVFDAAKTYDFHLFYDQMLEQNGEPDQECAYDDLFGYAGLADVTDSWKRPRVELLDEDFAELASFRWPAQWAVVQLQASNPNRTYPPDQLARFCVRYLQRYPQDEIVLVGEDKPVGLMLMFENAFEAELDLADIHGKDRTDYYLRMRKLVGLLKSFRSLVPLVARARLVVGPDSSLGHLAAAFPKVPVISLWGLFDPDDRVKYYRNHTPLFFPLVCPHAPCRNHQFKLPQEQCREALNATPGEQPWCNALRHIDPETILRTATELFTA